MTEQVGKHRVAAKKTIQSAFQELHKAPDEREKALLAQCGETVTSKFTNLQIQMEEMASLQTETTSCCAAISETQKSHTVVMVLQTQLEELMTKFTAMNLQLQEDDSLTTVVKTIPPWLVKYLPLGQTRNTNPGTTKVLANLP